MAALCTCLQHLITLHSWSTQAEVMSDGKLSLFSSDSYSAQELLNRSADINTYCFYGRCIGFQVSVCVCDVTVILALVYL